MKMAHTACSRPSTRSAVGSISPICCQTRIPALPSILIKLGVSCSRTAHERSVLGCQRSRHTRRVNCPVASTSQPLETPENDEDFGDEFSSFDASELGPPPDVRYQPALHIKDRKTWRATAETMAKEKRLINVQVGQLGITQSFLCAAADVLQKHGLVRVKLGEGCGLERRSTAELLEEYLDCVCVHMIGFTITLYRQPGLPRPSNTVRDTDAVRAGEAAALQQKAAARAAVAQEKQLRKKAGQQTPKERPPEFNVL